MKTNEENSHKYYFSLEPFSIRITLFYKAELLNNLKQNKLNPRKLALLMIKVKCPILRKENKKGQSLSIAKGNKH